MNIAKKIANKLKISEKKIKFSNAIFPKILMLEVTNRCNLKCVMCNNKNMKRKKGDLNLELGLKAINQAADFGIKEIALYTTGEPLLYPELEKLILEAKKRKLYCYITSNGLLLNAKIIDMLCNSGLDSFKFSIDSVDKETYLKIKGIDGFDRVLENIKLLKNKSKELNSNLKIICSMINMNENENQINKFKNIFKPFCDDILITEELNLGNKIKNKRKYNFEINEKKICKLLWDRIIINYDGKVTACCVDFDGELIYGDFFKASLKEIWNNQTIVKWRELHLQGQIEKMKMCNICDAPIFNKASNLLKLNETII